MHRKPNLVQINVLLIFSGTSAIFHKVNVQPPKPKLYYRYSDTTQCIGGGGMRDELKQEKGFNLVADQCTFD